MSTVEKFKSGIEKPCNKLKNVTAKLKILKSKLGNLNNFKNLSILFLNFDFELCFLNYDF